MQLRSISDSPQFQQNQRPQRLAELAKVFEDNHRLFTILAAQNLFKRLKREAEDVVQDAFTSAVEQIDRFRGDSSLKTWVGVIILRTAWRRNKSKEPVLDYYENIEPFWEGSRQKDKTRASQFEDLEAGKIFEAIESNDTLDALLEHLSEEQREFITAWRRDEFRGRMEESSNRNNLSRSKAKMRLGAIKTGVIPEAA